MIKAVSVRGVVSGGASEDRCGSRETSSVIVKHPKDGSVEFVFDQASDEAPFVVGDWDRWSLPGTPMVAVGGLWKVTLSLSPGEHQFKYRVGDRWFNDFFADRYVKNGLGGDNSAVVVEPPKPPRRPKTRRASARGRSR
jgi:Glycogen recognition site of AMP-activated protein kinase